MNKPVIFLIAFLLLAGCSEQAVDIQYTESVKPDVLQIQTAADRTLPRRNSPPRIISSRFSPSSPKRGDTIVAEVVAEDTDGDTIDLKYEWTVNETAYPNDRGKILRADIMKGDIVSVKITPYDDSAEGTPVISMVKVRNSHPEIDTELTDVAISNNTCYAQVIASDADGDNLTYLLKKSPAIMDIDEATGKLHWTVTGEKTNQYDISITVKDTEGAESVLNLTIQDCYPYQEAFINTSRALIFYS